MMTTKPTEEDPKFKVYVETYRGYKIYTNNYCHLVKLGKKERYFYNDGTTIGQINRCKKEVDDFIAGEIE